MNDVNELIGIIEEYGGRATTEKILSSYCIKYHMILQKSYTSAIENTLKTTKDKVRFDESTKEWYVDQRLSKTEFTISAVSENGLTDRERMVHKLNAYVKKYGTEDIKSVEDVSVMNVGYDAKAITKNGQEQYYEIKSVTSLGDPIKITNNEYTHAHKYKDKFYLAIAAQQEDYIELCIIANPIETLNLTKRIVQVEWICNEYEGKYSKTFF